MKYAIWMIGCLLVSALAWSACDTKTTTESAPLASLEGVIAVKGDDARAAHTDQSFERLVREQAYALRLYDPYDVTINETWVETVGEVTYAYARGVTGEGNCSLTRIPMETVAASFDDGAQGYQMIPTGDKCIGDPCSECGFLSTGGCYCAGSGKDGEAGWCNHEISSGTPG